MFVDTHSHIYSEAFNSDRDQAIERAVAAGVRKIVLPNIDSATITSVMDLADSYPGLFVPLIGLHPTSVTNNFRNDLKIIESWYNKGQFSGIGEIGIDLYHDKTFIEEQLEAFSIQLGWAKKSGIPIVIHVRDSFSEVMGVLEKEKGKSLTGVFHSFTGNADQAHQIIGLGFKIGIGGIVTFKNSGLGHTVEQIDLRHIVLETDSPWLTPVPHRGRRNESAYIPLIAARVAALHHITVEEVARITTMNAQQLFGF